MKPAKTADIPVDDKDLRSCEWLIEIAQYVDLGIMKALDEPEWQALIGKGDHKRPSGDSIVKRFEDSVEGREQLDTSEIAQFVNERAWWEDWIVERLPYHQIKRERFRNGSCERLRFRADYDAGMSTRISTYNRPSWHSDLELITETRDMQKRFTTVEVAAFNTNACKRFPALSVISW